MYINGLGKLSLHYFSKVHKVKFYYHLLLVGNTLFLDLFWLYFKDCFHKDDKDDFLRCVCKPQHVAISSLNEQFNNDRVC